jgi:tetratricopeptide (TPR) repeat protein
VWQKLYDGLQDRNFMIIAVAMDSRTDAARPWIEAVSPSYLSLLDTNHHVADLYNMVNVPQAVWIDDDGRIVRPPETAGAFEGFRALDRTSGKMPEEIAQKTANAKATYVAAVRDWVIKGTASEHAFDKAAARAHLALPGADIAQAHANFRLGQYLLRQGRESDAEACFGEAIRLHPQSWNIWRQTAQVNDTGLAAGPEFWARVDALGENKYYAAVDMVGMPD